jgi:hypothetical protein
MSNTNLPVLPYNWVRFIMHLKVDFLYIHNLVDGRGSIPDRGRGFFPLPSASRPALGPTQAPVQWVPGARSPRVKRGRGVMLTTHPLLMPRLRKSRSYTSSHPKVPLWSVKGPFFTLFYVHNLPCVDHAPALQDVS